MKIPRKVLDYQVNFQYDILGSRTKVTDPFGLAADYQYNNLNRLTTVSVEGKSFTYEYYPDGMVKAVNYPVLGNGSSIRAEYTYDNINRLKTVTNKIGSQVIAQYSYGYDNSGNITSITENGQTTSYTYDALNRLKTITRPGGETLTYQYDTRGNRTAGGKSASGSVGRSYDYDSLDRLSSFTADGETKSYSYDPEGLRTKKASPAGTVRYHLDNTGRVIAESNANGKVTAQNIWGIQALARKVNGVYYYYIYNGHGDVVKVIDQAGNVVNSYSYDEWGNILSRQEQLPQPLKYAGEYCDDESGLYYLRARYYDPAVGRFISKDSYEGNITNPLSLNLYSYVENNPLLYVDPSGHMLVQLRAWVGMNKGNVSWDESTRTATATVNGYTNHYKIDDYDVINSYIYVDDELLKIQFRLDIINRGLYYANEAAKVVEPVADAYFDVATLGSGTLLRSGVKGIIKGNLEKSAHALLRNSQGRPVGTVINDLQKAKKADILIQEDGRWIIKGGSGRIHVVEPDGSQVVTTFKNPSRNTAQRIKDGRWSIPTSDQLKLFENIFSDYVRW